MVSGTATLHMCPVPPGPLEGPRGGPHSWLRPCVSTTPPHRGQPQPCAPALCPSCPSALLVGDGGSSTSGPGPGPASTPSSSDTCCFMLTRPPPSKTTPSHSTSNHHLAAAATRKPSGTSRLWSAHTWLSVTAQPPSLSPLRAPRKQELSVTSEPSMSRELLSSHGGERSRLHAALHTRLSPRRVRVRGRPAQPGVRGQGPADPWPPGPGLLSCLWALPGLLPGRMRSLADHLPAAGPRRGPSRPL